MNESKLHKSRKAYNQNITERPGFPSLGKQQRGQSFQSILECRDLEHPQLQDPAPTERHQGGCEGCSVLQDITQRKLKGDELGSQTVLNIAALCKTVFAVSVSIGHTHLPVTELRVAPFAHSMAKQKQRSLTTQ